jgi:Glycosyl hydrolase family 20, catalytic domain
MLSYPIVGVHLDLKYVMPSKAYLWRWVRDLPTFGINTLLLEYEDKFPFQRHPFMREVGAFTTDELRDFLSAARAVGLRVIPMVPTLSHLEHALAHEELAPLRQAPDVITQIDPANPDAVGFVLEMIDEVLEFHQEDEWFHIGADEAWHLRQSAVDARAAWAQHTAIVARHVVSRGKRPIVWDDALWSDPSSITSCDLPKQTIVSSWNYTAGDSESSVQKHACRLESYRAAGFDTLGQPCLNWGEMVPRLDHCLQNTRGWMLATSRCGSLGVINSAWAVFHVLPHAQCLTIAATGRLANDPLTPFDDASLATLLAQRYGVTAEVAIDAVRGMRLASPSWEHPDHEAGRPITPILYGYMDLSSWFGSQSRRRAVGSYPHDMSTPDYDEIFRRKLRILRHDNADGSVGRRLDELVLEFRRAVASLSALDRVAARNRDEAAYLTLASELKLTQAMLLREWLGGPVSLATTEAWLGLGDRLNEVMAPFVEPPWRWFPPRVWWEPTTNYLNEHNGRESTKATRSST